MKEVRVFTPQLRALFVYLFWRAGLSAHHWVQPCLCRVGECRITLKKRDCYQNKARINVVMPKQNKTTTIHQTWKFKLKISLQC